MNSIFHRISVRKYEDRPIEKGKNHGDSEGGNAGTECM